MTKGQGWKDARQGQAKVLTPEEEARVYTIAAAGKHGKRDVCILDFSFRAGLRAKEIAALMIDDVTDAKGRIVDSFILKHSQAKGDTGGTVHLTSKRLRKNLAAYLKEREGDTNRHLFKSQKDVFTGNTIQMLMARIYKKADIKGAKSHSGRRTFATRLIEAGYNIKAVSQHMRHSNIQTTAKYIATNPIAMGKMLENL